MSLCLVGMALLAKQVLSTDTTCVSTWIPECLCGCTTADLTQTIRDTLLVYDR